MKNKRIELFLYSKYINFIITFVILLSCCYLSKFPTVEYINDMITLLFTIILILFYLLKCEISKISLSLILYIALLCVSSLLGENSSIALLLKNYFKIVALVFYLDYGLKYYPKTVVKSFYLSYSILVLINFYTIIKYPNGLYQGKIYSNNWFLEYDNIHIFTYIPTLMFMFINQYLMKRKLYIIEYLLIVIITYCIFYCFSATSVIGYIMILGYLLFERYISKKEIFNAITYFVSYIGIFLRNSFIKASKHIFFHHTKYFR